MSVAVQGGSLGFSAGSLSSSVASPTSEFLYGLGCYFSGLGFPNSVIYQELVGSGDLGRSKRPMVR